MTTARLGRGAFLKVVSVAGTGFALGAGMRDVGAATMTSADFSPQAWLAMHADGSVTVMCNNAEMGQGIATTAAMLVADELDHPLERTHFMLAPAEPRYYDPNLKAMSTGGSRSTKSMGPVWRRAGATARAMLVTAAAQRWGIDPATCRTTGGAVLAPDGRRLAYTQLLEAAALLPVPTDVRLKTPDQFTLIGTRRPRLDVREKTNGRAIYGIDVTVEGMAYASIEKPREIGAKVASYDAGDTLKVPGVLAAYPVTSGIAVVATNTWAAFRGRKALRITWASGPNVGVSTASLYARGHSLVATPGAVVTKTGDANTALTGASVTVSAVYQTPYLAHATMEPMNCTADVRADRVTLWVPTQSPTSAQKAAAKVTGLPITAVTVKPTFLGGGFGRRGEIDYVVDAVETSKAAGRPVKLVWTREDDIRNDQYRPGTVHALRGAIAHDGSLVAYMHTLACDSINARTAPARMVGELDPGVKAGSSDFAYTIPNVLVDYHQLKAGIDVGHWRAPYANANTFATESFIDELAHAAGADPLAFRLAMLPPGRARTVLELAAKTSGWNVPLDAGRARGVAMAQWDDEWVAVVAEVSMPGGKIKVHRLTAAIDVGQPVNLDGLEAQLTSAMIYGLSATLVGEITFAAGAPVQGNFNDYPVLYMSEAPEFRVAIVPSHEPSLGAGELGTPCVAPAVANAVFTLTGKRGRSLPLPASLG